jgi:cytochrome P450
MEVRIVFEELLQRVRAIELTGRPERLRSNFFNGIKRLPVRVAL